MNELLNYFNGDELAANVWQSKYATKGEKTPDDMHKRMAKEFARIEQTYIDIESGQGYVTKHKQLSKYGKIRQRLSEKRIYNMFKDFKYIIPQGRVMAGLGVTESYRSLSNCLRLPPPKDSYSSIMYTDTMLVSAAKRGCGYGLGLSGIRPRKTLVSNAANSSTGAASFMERYSTSTREVAQEGRRGACLEDMSIFHPDILEFISKKKDKTKVTGANISVKLYDEFMDAVENDEKFILRFPCDMVIHPIEEAHLKITCNLNELHTLTEERGYIKSIKAKEYWEIIIENAWENAEPGLFYWNRVLDYDPSSVYDKYYIDGTNACGEQPMAVYDTCRLILLNLYSYVKEPFTIDAKINYDLLYKMSYEQMRLGDDLVDLEIEYIDRIITKIMSDDIPIEEKQIELDLWKNVKDIAKSGRRVGAGVTALADMIAAVGFKYDSDEAFELVEKVMKTKMKAELDATIDLSILRGTFQGWDRDNEFLCEGFKRTGENSFYQMLVEEFPYQVEEMLKYGRRNVNWNTIAPAGSVSIIAKTESFCNMSSGCEPTFMPFYMRKKKINPSEEGVRVDFTDDNGDTWQEYPVMMGAFKQWLLKQKHNKGFVPERMSSEDLNIWYKKSPWYKSTANDINWIKRVKMQGLLQKYTTSAISSTLNLPKDVTKEEVSEIYLAGWKEGLKGLTIYRDGCRTGVLSTESVKDQFVHKDAVKRPKELYAESHITTCKGEAYNVLVGLLDSKPYEVFMDNSDNKYSSTGKLVKVSRGKYVFKNGSDPVDVRSFMTPEEEAITRLVSANLRHGVNIKFIVEQLQKTPGDMFSFTKGLARVLKKYIPDGSNSTVHCLNPECTGDGTNVVFQEGCSICKDCGSSKCG